MKISLFEEVVERIRAKSNMIINLSAGPGGRLIIGPNNQPNMDLSTMEPPERRVEHVMKLHPEMCSLDVGTVGLPNGVFVNIKDVVEKMAELIKGAGVKPEVELFEVGHIEIAKKMLSRGLLEKPVHFQLCMGTMMGIAGTPKNAVHFSECLPMGQTWSIFGVGKYQFRMVAMGVLLNGHVRVGFEDNLYLSKGVLAKSNADLVKRAADIIRNLNKNVASVVEAREILGLK
jgi:uncharacterized protein (DUF849 family)